MRALLFLLPFVLKPSKEGNCISGEIKALGNKT
nr:MAG TPA: hypothetical protein [Caudoviricetes sp.]